MRRRLFLKCLAGTPASVLLRSQTTSLWGGPVLDTHLHLRQNPDDCYTHMQGCGVTHAVLLTRAVDEEKASQEMLKRPHCFARSVSADPAKEDSDRVIRNAVSSGAVSIGEIKFHLALDSPEMKRLFQTAGELRVPVMMHIQTFPHFPGELPYNTGYEHFDRVLTAYPKTNFIGHGDLFWANISADVPTDRGYPSGPIRPGGLTDLWLSRYPNLYADMSANSGNNALSRDPEFSHRFFVRHQEKLIFGSDCSCTDGNGGGVSQNNNPEANRLAGKCVARATLGLTKQLTTPEIFRKVTWQNGVRLFNLAASREEASKLGN